MIEEGSIYSSNNCGKFIVVKNIRHNEVHIKFLETGTEIIVPRSVVGSGRVKDLAYPTVFGKGYLGKGVNLKTINSYPTVEYYVWYSMLRRCYSPTERSKSTYAGVTVCDEWHNFQNFADWHKRYYIEGFHIDKDLMLFGNKIYSPEFCSFVPNEINSFCPRYNSERIMPTGVKKRKEKYLTEVYVDRKLIYSKTFSTPEEAFEMYCTIKSQRAKELAIKWKDSLHPSVYENLLNFDTRLYLSK